ncbi:MAG: hypothetical protein IIC56_04655, partial [Proteobacteria bacterium]|nr:hypothetical protein [Pseudomonadota bacterium]
LPLLLNRSSEIGGQRLRWLLDYVGLLDRARSTVLQNFGAYARQTAANLAVETIPGNQGADAGVAGVGPVFVSRRSLALFSPARAWACWPS